MPKHERTDVSSTLFLSWSSYQLKDFLIDSFPLLANAEYDLMFADREKNLHILPSDVDTSMKIKQFGMGRSALYIRPRQSLEVAYRTSLSAASGI
jgi:hypothetical protein